MEIRKATAADAQLCLDIRKAAIVNGCRESYPQDDLAIWISGGLEPRFVEIVAQHFYIGEMEQQGVAIGFVDVGTAQLEAIFVRPDVMGKGAGRAMVAFLEQRAIEKGIEHLSLQATLNAVPFYRACGYGNEQQAMYHSPRGVSLPCVMMSKALSSEASSE